MTREDIHLALNNFYNAMSEAGMTSWNIGIHTKPFREIYFHEDFLNKYLGNDCFTKEHFSEVLGKIPEAIWKKSADGKLSITSFDIEKYI